MNGKIEWQHDWKELTKISRVCTKCGISQNKTGDFGGSLSIRLRNPKWMPKVSKKCGG